MCVTIRSMTRIRPQRGRLKRFWRKDQNFHPTTDLMTSSGWEAVMIVPLSLSPVLKRISSAWEPVIKDAQATTTAAINATALI